MTDKTLVSVLGVVYAHMKTSNGGDIYFTRYAEEHIEHLAIHNWFEKRWFNKHKVRLRGTGSVYKVPTKIINGTSLDLVVKNCRVGEDVPLDTHTLEEFCNAEFNSPWEEFSLVEEMREGKYGTKEIEVTTQLPLAIYVPPNKMQLWQSGRSRSKINRIRERHPGIDLDILKQYKLIYRWIDGLNLVEIFELIKVENDERLYHLKTLDSVVTANLHKKGYLVADTKPEHIIISESDVKNIFKIGTQHTADAPAKQVDCLYNCIKTDNYSVIDYELLLRTNEHEAEVQHSRRHFYLDNQISRYIPSEVPEHLSCMDIFGVPYIYGHAESTGGHLWVVGSNARLFDYFLPERWRKTPSIKLPGRTETFFTITKDNVRLVWETSQIGELPGEINEAHDLLTKKYGINSPFEEFAIAHELTALGIPCAYVRAIYMTGSRKIEKSLDLRRFKSHKDMLNPDGSPVLRKDRNYITIRGYYNGPDQWVALQTGALYERIDLADAEEQKLINSTENLMMTVRVKKKLKDIGYEGALIQPSDLLMSIDSEGNIVMDSEGLPVVVVCNFQYIWKLSGTPFSSFP